MNASYAKIAGMVQERRSLDPTACALMLVLTALWGFQQVAIKSIAADVSLVMQAALRSAIASALLLAWARQRGTALFERDGTLVPGVVAGLLFGGEFVFIYAGLGFTNASRMSVFVYLAPALTALGLHFLVRAERLSAAQWGGVAVAFLGLFIAFADGFFSGQDTWRGDLCGVVAAFLWAATTVLIRASRLAAISATKTLFYQVAVSSVVLFAASRLLGEKGIVTLTPKSLAALAYQGAIVAFASYLAWFWLLTRYSASRLAVLSFVTPVFGVLFGVAFLKEPLTGDFALGAGLVVLGLVLVNLRR